MVSIIEDFRQIRASEQRADMSFRLLETIDAAARSHRLASSALNRLRSSDITASNREWMLDDLADARADLARAIEKIDAMAALCREPSPAVFLEAAE